MKKPNPSDLKSDLLLVIDKIESSLTEYGVSQKALGVILLIRDRYTELSPAFGEIFKKCPSEIGRLHILQAIVDIASNANTDEFKRIREARLELNDLVKQFSIDSAKLLNTLGSINRRAFEARVTLPVTLESVPELILETLDRQSRQGVSSSLPSEINTLKVRLATHWPEVSDLLYTLSQPIDMGFDPSDEIADQVAISSRKTSARDIARAMLMAIEGLVDPNSCSGVPSNFKLTDQSMAELIGTLTNAEISPDVVKKARQGMIHRR